MRLALYRYRLPLTRPLMPGDAQPGKREGPTQKSPIREGLLLEIDGQWGEIAPLPGFSRESLDEAEAESLACLEALARGRAIAPRLPSVSFGFDCALRRWPPAVATPPEPCPLLQGPPLELLAGLDDLARTWETAAVRKAKLKVARHVPQDELTLIRRLTERFPALMLVLDANGGWSRAQALAFCSRLPVGRIDYLEDPCADFADSAAVAAASGVRIAVDEPLARGLPWHPVPQLAALVIKPTLVGSLARCEALVREARRLGLRTVVSSSFESDLGLGLLARLAAEWAPDEPPGLDTRRWLAKGLLAPNGLPERDALIRLHRSDGHHE